MVLQYMFDACSRFVVSPHLLTLLWATSWSCSTCLMQLDVSIEEEWDTVFPTNETRWFEENQQVSIRGRFVVSPHLLTVLWATSWSCSTCLMLAFFFRVTASSHIALGYLLALQYLYDACSRFAVSPHLLIALGYSGLAVHVWCFSSLSVCMLPCLGYFLPWRCRSVALRVHIICLCFAVVSGLGLDASSMVLPHCGSYASISSAFAAVVFCRIFGYTLPWRGRSVAPMYPYHLLHEVLMSCVCCSAVVFSCFAVCVAAGSQCLPLGTLLAPLRTGRRDGLIRWSVPFSLSLLSAVVGHTSYHAVRLSQLSYICVVPASLLKVWIPQGATVSDVGLLHMHTQPYSVASWPHHVCAVCFHVFAVVVVMLLSCVASVWAWYHLRRFPLLIESLFSYFDAV